MHYQDPYDLGRGVDLLKSAQAQQNTAGSGSSTLPYTATGSHERLLSHT